MRAQTNTAALTALVAAISMVALVSGAQARVVLGSRGPGYHRAPSNLEIVLEGGLAEPMGDQDDDFWTTVNGFGSSTGYQVGARLRQYLGPDYAVSPVFQYTRFGSASGLTDFGSQTDLAFDVRTSSYRYGVDFQAFMGGAGSPARIFATGGVALINNRYRDALEFNGVYEASVNAPAFSVGLGAKLRNIEIAGEYTFNRFETNKFDANGNTLDYNWDFLVVRFGLGFGH